MADVNWERVARATGIGFVVLFVAAFIVAGETPGVNDSVAQITAYYGGDRGRILTATFIFGAALIFFLWFVGALASTLREAGRGGWGATTIAAGATAGGFVLVIIALQGGLAYKIAEGGDTGVVQAFSDLIWTCNVVVSFPFAALIFAASMGLWRAGVVADWFGWVGLAAATVALLGGTTWAQEGFWAPDGTFTYITIVVVLAWTLVASGLLSMRAPATERAPERAATTPTA